MPDVKHNHLVSGDLGRFAQKRRHENSQRKSLSHLGGCKIFPASIVFHPFGASRFDVRDFPCLLDAGFRQQGIGGVSYQPDVLFGSGPKNLNHFRSTHILTIQQSILDVKKPVCAPARSATGEFEMGELRWPVRPTMKLLGACPKVANHRGNGRPARLETEPRSNTSAAHGRDAHAPWKIPAIATFGDAPHSHIPQMNPLRLGATVF
jgi:hypothetical protein